MLTAKSTIFIPGNVPSSKNSRRNFGKISLPSKLTCTYIENTKWHYALNQKKFQNLVINFTKPLRINFKFIRDSRRKFDYINALQIVQDLMVKNNWIEDDNADFLVPSFENYEYDKNNAGVYISLTESSKHATIK